MRDGWRTRELAGLACHACGNALDAMPVIDVASHVGASGRHDAVRAIRPRRG